MTIFILFHVVSIKRHPLPNTDFCQGMFFGLDMIFFLVLTDLIRIPSAGCEFSWCSGPQLSDATEHENHESLLKITG